MAFATARAPRHLPRHLPRLPRLRSSSPPAGRAGVPMEVMGLMLGEFVDEFTVRCVDVFAMPQAGTSVSVESVDPVFQQQVRAAAARAGTRATVRPRRRHASPRARRRRRADARHAQGHGAARKRGRLVPLAPGCVAARAQKWAVPAARSLRPRRRGACCHSRPCAGFGCWLSGVDCNTQQSFEQLHPRCVPRGSLRRRCFSSPLPRPLPSACPLLRAGAWRWWWTPSSRSRGKWSSTRSG
jgi:hypothetical protein